MTLPRRPSAAEARAAASTLAGVPRTMLWTLHCRAAFAERGELDDPEAIAIRDRLGLDLRREFGRPDPAFARRARRFDGVVQGFLDRHAGQATVVSLGEGLETQRSRVRGYRRWVSVDLPEAMAVRIRLLPDGPAHTHRAASAQDPRAWLDSVEPPAMVVAQGLLMYLPRLDVVRLLGAALGRGAERLVFDVVPPWVARMSRFPVPMTRRFWVPRMAWGARRAAVERLAEDAAGARDHRVELLGCPLPGGPIRWVDHTLVAVIDAGAA